MFKVVITKKDWLKILTATRFRNGLATNAMKLNFSKK